MSRAPTPGPDGEAASLSELQLDIMRVLWTRGACTTTEVTEALRAERNLAHTTVSTLLTRLEKRGVVGATRDGRQLIYRAAIEEAQVRRSMVSGLLDSLFGGDAQALVAHLVREDEIAAEDLAAVRELLARRKADRS
jgi:BlaI family penicillinase repressor